MPGLTAMNGGGTGFAGAKTCHQLLFQLPGEVCRPQLLSTFNRVSGFALFYSLTPVSSQIRCFVHLTSYSFLHTPPLASDALVILIIFPRGWGDPAFFETAGFVGQTKSSLSCFLFVKGRADPTAHHSNKLLQQ
jgi:hypothetical protein